MLSILVNTQSNYRGQRARVVFTDVSLIARASFLKWFTLNRNILLAVSYFHHCGNEL